MSVNDRLPSDTEFKAYSTSYKKVGTKFQGVIGCSVTGEANDPTATDYIADTPRDTPEEAMRAVTELFEQANADARSKRR